MEMGNEEALAHWGLSHHGGEKYFFHLRAIDKEYH
jgi:hypothetical protein